MYWKKRLLTLLAILGATSGCDKEPEPTCYAPMPLEGTPQQSDAEDLDKAKEQLDKLEADDKLSLKTVEKARDQIEMERKN